MIQFLTGTACYQLIDSGLANILVVETLKHGTDPVSNVQIRLAGANPGYCRANGPNPRQRDFFVIKENAGWFHSVFWPRYFSGATAGSRCFNALTYFPKPIRNVAFLIGTVSSSLLTPTLNFRFCKDELHQNNRFENDLNFLPFSMESPAYKTQHKIEAWRIGLPGTFLVGLNQGLLERIQQNPQRFMKGAIQLTGAAALAWYSPTLSTVSFIAGFVLG